MNVEDSSTIYIVLTYTGTFLSRLIKIYTRSKFCHVSLALDENLNEMYSFGRLNPYNPFIGGFVHENTNWGTFKRFKNTKAAIYSLEITKEQYEKISNIIKNIDEHKQLYKFNILGLFATGFHIKLSKQNSFYCAEFVKFLVEEAQINLNLPALVKPNDFMKIEDLQLQYQGILRNYKIISQ